ncbi:HD domain-containing protein [Rubrivivax sp. A210]|uniref:HD-GYP domain-containing protein n=1 Tax=Rubrivivax sp. A210 TaxID=2772301 RepID=UPI00191A0DE5|nr:HD domain-containing phosphohydrolase [Rubrivivax sp. A210]CAD5371893.1 HD domain-containing protein [Rubrivivax sp. A210]
MSTSPRQDNTFGTANPHALATILEASETRSIIAATDIFDISGIKLWSSKQPVSAALQRKLIDRQLRQPLESCLIAEDGVNTLTLVEAIDRLVQGDTALTPLLAPHAARLVKEAAQLPLNPVAQLLLSASQTARPQRFEHAMAGMALAGALMAGNGGDTPEIRLAMLCGLLHDLGEMYIDPRHGEAEADRELDFLSYQQLVVHPHVGHLLIAQLTNYPSVVSRAIAEHHERLDGSGYPHALPAERISPLGRLLAVTEATLTALRGEGRQLLHASVALRTVPGEYDLSWVGRVSQAACAQPPSPAVMEHEDIQARLAALGEVLASAETNVARLKAEASVPALQDALALADFLLQRLRTGWNESGMWNPGAMAGADAAEVEALEDEIYFRLRGVQRATLMRAGKLEPTEAEQLNTLCDSLAMG